LTLLAAEAIVGQDLCALPSAAGRQPALPSTDSFCAYPLAIRCNHAYPPVCPRFRATPPSLCHSE
jgi:hypothetical protein